jgi:CheY-like chemotaxis protein
MDAKHNLRVLFVDDDPFGAQGYVDSLVEGGFEVVYARSVRRALNEAKGRDFDAAVLDVRMSPGGQYSQIETAGGFATGVALARDLQEILPGAIVVALTASRDPGIQEFFASSRYTRYFYRPETEPPQFCRSLKHLLKFEVSPKVFLVHGHDHTTRDAVRRFIRERLGFKDVIVLADERSGGTTVFEKLEKASGDADLVFVLLTPDDFSASRSRARQNVILECGYFLGKLGRHSGRVIFLKKGDLELPSDLSGVVYVDISEGLERAEEAIRREAADWL